MGFFFGHDFLIYSLWISYMYTKYFDHAHPHRRLTGFACLLLSVCFPRTVPHGLCLSVHRDHLAPFTLLRRSPVSSGWCRTHCASEDDCELSLPSLCPKWMYTAIVSFVLLNGFRICCCVNGLYYMCGPSSVDTSHLKSGCFTVFYPNNP